MRPLTNPAELLLDEARRKRLEEMFARITFPPRVRVWEPPMDFIKDKQACPVCSRPVNQTHSDEVGGALAEQTVECPNGCYHYDFSYDNQLIGIGPWWWDENFGASTSRLLNWKTGHTERRVVTILLREAVPIDGFDRMMRAIRDSTGGYDSTWTMADEYARGVFADWLEEFGGLMSLAALVRMDFSGVANHPDLLAFEKAGLRVEENTLTREVLVSHAHA